jgi:ABC-2 type transport system ATP-binding protein
MNKTDEIAIKVSNVSKSFKLPHEKNTSVKSFVTNPFKKRTFEKQQVLKDINFEIKKGEFFGIVGRNGSGKSTLLKLLAGIYSPDKGHIQINGKLTPFIELGVGFNPELTGRENVFLNGALLGFNRKEMALLYDEIVEFAELEKFMDQKLKNYSSGMQVRLAFSIAIRAESEILVLDEVLAVGDEAFQRKCTSVFEKYKSSGKTIVLVTHDMGVVEKFCNKALLISEGKILTEGNPRKVAKQYSNMNEESYILAKDKELAKREKEAYIKNLGVKWKIYSADKKSANRIKRGEKVIIDLSWESNDIKNIGIALLKNSGEYIFGTNTIIDDIKIVNKSLSYTLKMNVGNGDYKFIIGLFGKTEAEALEFIENGPTVYVVKDQDDWGGIAKLEHTWN